MRTERKEQITGILLIAAAALIWGWNGPISKGLNTSVDVLTVIFLRSVIAVAAATPIFLLFDRSIFRVTFRQFLFLFLYGAFVVLGTTVGFFYALQYLSVSSALLLHYSFPILTMAGAIFILGEYPSPVQVLSAFLILLGVGLGVLDSPGHTGQISAAGILWGLLAVVGISLQTLCGRLASVNGFVPQLTLLYHGFLWSVVAAGLCKTATIGWGDIFLISVNEWILIVALGLIGSLTAHFLYLMGLRRITAPLGSLVSSLELAAATVFGMALLKEIPTKAEIIGSVIVIAAIALASSAPEKASGKTEEAKSCST